MSHTSALQCTSDMPHISTQAACRTLLHYNAQAACRTFLHKRHAAHFYTTMHKRHAAHFYTSGMPQQDHARNDYYAYGLACTYWQGERQQTQQAACRRFLSQDQQAACCSLPKQHSHKGCDNMILKHAVARKVDKWSTIRPNAARPASICKQQPTASDAHDFKARNSTES